jgi:hypothetical protein
VSRAQKVDEPEGARPWGKEPNPRWNKNPARASPWVRIVPGGGPGVRLVPKGGLAW